MAIKRISRCHPMGGAGYDPIKEKSSNKKYQHKYPAADRICKKEDGSNYGKEDCEKSGCGGEERAVWKSPEL
mgnify:CR=1 FL=1